MRGGGDVTIQYEARPDTKINYFNGERIRLYNRVNKILTFANFSKIKDYSPVYEVRSDITKSFSIKSLKVCKDQDQCLNENSFNYTDVQENHEFDNQSMWSTRYGHNTGWRTDKYIRMVVDVNGDGLSDIVGFAENGTYISLSLASSLNHLQSVSDSNGGNTTELSYKLLTDRSVYTKGSGAQLPVRDLQYPQYVVIQVETSNGIGGTTTVQYQYEGLKSHVQGRGSYGYAKVTEIYPNIGKTKEIISDQSGFPFGSAHSQERVIEK